MIAHADADDPHEMITRNENICRHCVSFDFLNERMNRNMIAWHHYHNNISINNNNNNIKYQRIREIVVYISGVDCATANCRWNGGDEAKGNNFMIEEE